MKKAKRGRPALPPDQQRTRSILLTYTAAERELIDKAAGGKPVKWARELVLRAAKRKARP